MTATAHEQIMAELAALGACPDHDIDLADTALLLAALDHPGIVLDRYRSHLQALANDVAQRHDERLAGSGDDSADLRLGTLVEILHDKNNYRGDKNDYDNLDNADLIRVIDRRLGMPIALAILYIAAGRAQLWDIRGLNLPGHFLARIDYGAHRLIFDPFNSGRVMQAADMRALLKETHGAQAELSADYYNPVSNRDILLRLMNNRKFRLIESEDYEKALSAVFAMRAFAPGEYRLLLDEGVLCARLERNQAAIIALESYINQAPGAQDRHDAALLLKEIKQSLN